MAKRSRDRALDIAHRYGIAAASNPGSTASEGHRLLPDQEVFDAAGIPVLSVEATNWSLGDKDGYQQRAVSPHFPQGITGTARSMTTCSTDRYLPGRIDKRSRDSVQILLPLIKELARTRRHRRKSSPQKQGPALLSLSCDSPRLAFVQAALALQPEETRLFLAHTRFPLLGGGYRHRQVALLPQRVIAQPVLGQILVNLAVVPVDDRQDLEHPALHRQHRQIGAAAGLLAPQAGEPALCPQRLQRAVHRLNLVDLIVLFNPFHALFPQLAVAPLAGETVRRNTCRFSFSWSVS